MQSGSISLVLHCVRVPQDPVTRNLITILVKGLSSFQHCWRNVASIHREGPQCRLSTLPPSVSNRRRRRETYLFVFSLPRDSGERNSSVVRATEEGTIFVGATSTTSLNVSAIKCVG